MCGLTALIGTDISQADVLGFQKLAQLSSLRGQDSVGFYDYHLSPKHNEKECRYYKELGSAGLYFAEGGRWDNSFYWNRYFAKKNIFNAPVVLVAHARAATKGAVEKKNAHPFHQGNILGVHNGTIHTHFEGRDKFETDSEALFAYMNEHGEQKGLDMVNQLWSAAYALMWINLKERTFNIARNSDRTLYYMKHKHKDACFLSSDKLFLAAVLQYIGKDFDEPQMVPKEEWVVFELKKRNLLKTQEIVKIKGLQTYQGNQSVIPFPRDRDSANQNSNNGGNAGSTQNSGQSKTPIWDTAEILVDQLTEEDVPHRLRISENFAGNGGACYEIRPDVTKTFQEISKILENGCECCGHKPFSYEETYFFKDEVTFLCKACGNNIDAVRIVAEDVKNKLDAVAAVDNKAVDETTTDVVCH